MATTDARLPTVAEILASTDVLSGKHATNTVVRINEHMVVKYGRQVEPLEGQNLAYLNAESNVPVPKFYGMLSEPETERNFLIMENVKGETLASILDSLTPDEMTLVSQKIGDAINSLRSIPSPGYIGSLQKQPCFDGIFYTGERGASNLGPFASEAEMNQAILQNVNRLVPGAYLDLLRNILEHNKLEHKICFTHADLQPKNIMVERKTGDDGKADFAVTFVDWEFSGWYPDYWEFCNANGAARQRPKWLEMTRSFLSAPIQEYMMMELIRRILFF